MRLPTFMLLSVLTTISLYGQDESFTVKDDVRIRTRDGIQLAGHLSVPSTGERVPVLLRFTSYARPGDLKNNVYVFRLAASLGYAYAEIYTRGVGQSAGAAAPYEHDVNDVYDVIDWLSKQPWCNGQVAMGGGSYLGYTQWAALKNPHPALKTIVPMVAAAPGKDVPALNGVMPNYVMRWLSLFDGPYCNDASFNDSERWRRIYNTMHRLGLPSTKLDSLYGKPNETLQRWLSHATFDSYWSSKLPSTPAEFNRIHIPILTVTGYFDSNQRGALYYYNAHWKSTNKPDHYLLIGPYDHPTGQNQKHLARYHYYRFDSTAYVNKVQLAAQWYNHVLKNAPLPQAIKDKVNVYVIGSGWRYAPALAALAPDSLQLFLGTKTLSSQPPAATVSTVPFHAASIADTLQADNTYRTAIPHNHTDEFPAAGNGNEHYRHRTPMLTFDSPVLTRAFDLIGSPVSVLHVSVAGIRDADLELQFYEVTAEGKSYPLSNLVQRLSLLQDHQRTLLQEGTIYRCTLKNSYFIAKRIAPGSFIRLTLRVINEAGHQKNYGSGQEVARETARDARAGEIKIHHGHDTPSAILLPGSYIKQ